MSNTEKMLEIKDLSVVYETDLETVYAVNGVTLSLEKGATLGLVGETGAGKTTLALTLMRLLPERTGKVTSGCITFEGENIVELPEADMRKIRGDKIAMIFQDPMTSLDPLFTVEYQLNESLKKHTNLDAVARKARMIELLTLVGINQPERRIKQYPYEFSGGMRQRVMIAMALSCDPELLIADEPTTALDVTIQAQIVELLKELKDKLGMAIIFITHDLGVVSEICDKIIVMYAGKVVEEGMSRQIFYERCHPYTEGLLASVPKLDSDVSEKLKPIKGNPPDMSAVKPGCAFAPRCSCAMKICVREEPPECELDETHKASCWQVIKKAMQNT